MIASSCWKRCSRAPNGVLLRVRIQQRDHKRVAQHHRSGRSRVPCTSSVRAEHKHESTPSRNTKTPSIALTGHAQAATNLSWMVRKDVTVPIVA